MKTCKVCGSELGCKLDRSFCPACDSWRSRKTHNGKECAICALIPKKPSLITEELLDKIYNMN